MSIRGMARYALKAIMGKQGRIPQPGEMAPDFDVSSSSGERVCLSDLRGRWVVLWFFPKADTPG